VPKERWIVDNTRKKYQSAEDWESFMSKIGVTQAQRVYVTIQDSNHPIVVMS